VEVVTKPVTDEGVILVLCSGCGKELPSRADGPGRRATYHGATCRQRARRARLATAPDRVTMLDRLDQVEQVLITARRVVTAGHDPRAVLEQLHTIVTGLVSHNEVPEASAVQGDVTKSVTLPTETPSVIVELPAPPAERVSGVAEEPDAHRLRAATATDVIDPDVVRLVRDPDFEISGSYRVLATVKDDVVLVGIVRRCGRAAWQTLTPSHIAVSGGPWRTRQDALVHLLLHHDQTQRAGRRRS
jgi:hypothetical protein